jgi:D-alanine-D-alanine ligase-like ATP-grasp enzyme
MDPRVLVLAGGLSPEREVSLRSGDRVRDALDEAGIHAVVAALRFFTASRGRQCFLV